MARTVKVASRTKQASGKGTDDVSLSLQIRQTTNEREPAPAPRASVLTNVRSVGDQTRNDSISDMGTSSEIYLTQLQANEFSLGQDHLVAAMNQMVRLELFHKMK
jgi:hypothetical protein